MSVLDLHLVNGTEGDPSVYAFFGRTGEAVLFDVGNIEALSNKDLLKVRRVFVSHTHIDHFIGFDRLLRVNIPHFRRLELVGPPGFIDNVSSKLRGYLWNLVEPDQLHFTVHEVDADGHVRSAELTVPSRFRPVPLEDSPAPLLEQSEPVQAPVAIPTSLNDGSRIEAVVLDHATPVVAYAIQQGLQYKMNTERMADLQLAPGPWIKKLQSCVSRGALDEELEVAGSIWRVQRLAQEVMDQSAPKLLAYVTDIIFSEENLRRLKLLASGADTLLCETNFAAEDWQRAHLKHHLTTRQAALIAASCKVNHLKTFHFSSIYGTEAYKLTAEAQSSFLKFRSYSSEQLHQAIRAELDLC